MERWYYFIVGLGDKPIDIEIELLSDEEVE